MARLFELRPIPTDVVLRALAIAAIVYNHTTRLNLGGGMAFLLLLSGMNFARFAVEDATAPGIRRSIGAIARQIFLPSLLLILLSFAVYRRFDWLELLFIRHNPQRISAFPVWFSHLILQILAALYLVFSIPWVARATIRWPAGSMLLLFGASVLVRASAPLLMELPFIFNHVRDTMWNFLLGSVVYFLAMDPKTSGGRARWLAVACVVAGAMIGHDPNGTRFWWLIITGGMLISVRYIQLPNVLGRITVAVSAATFGIFLTHEVWFKVVSRVNEIWAGPEGIVHPYILFVSALLLGTLTWAAVVAFPRTLRTARVAPLGRATT
jgi:hypothetical protein